ncbi:solute carrier family 18 member [Aureococcus anophagefferens]|uniref:Solute carrier family 18 member n=1 Tax=Aureococcus anophagefferens TaxID=44056 RepID=A0ABR1FP91_AURAN
MADVTEGRGDRGKLLGVQQAAVALGFIGGPALGGGLAELAQYLGYACHLSVVPLRAVDVMAASPGDIGVLFSTVSAVAIFYAAMIAWGLGASLMTPARGHLRGRAPPKARGAVVSYSRVAQDSAFLCGPLAYGALADALSPSAAIFASSACSAAARWDFSPRARWRRCRRRPRRRFCRTTTRRRRGGPSPAPPAAMAATPPKAPAPMKDPPRDA